MGKEHMYGEQAEGKNAETALETGRVSRTRGGQCSRSVSKSAADLAPTTPVGSFLRRGRT